MPTRIPKTNRTLAQALEFNYRVAPAIDDFLEENPEYEWTADFKPKILDDAWHPSGDCTPSVYELWLKASGQNVRKPNTLSQKKTFQLGHYFHQWIQDILLRIDFAEYDAIERRGGTFWGETLFVEPPWHDGSPIELPEAAWNLFPEVPGQWRVFHKPAAWHWATGSADVAPCKLVDGSHVLLDIKSISSVDAKSNTPPARYVDKWECQACIYLDWFDLDEAIFLGVSKESPHNFREWSFKANPPLVDAIYEKWRLVSMCLDEGEEVPEDFDIELPLLGPQA